MPRCEAIIFDLDGTLLDSLDDLANACNYAMQTLGRPTHARDQYRQMVGQGVEELIVAALGPEHQHLFGEAMTLHKDRYAARMADATRPYAGVLSMLQTLHETGLKLSILSNKPQAATAQVVPKFLPAPLFEQIWGHRESMPLKPEPDAALALARALDVMPSRIAFVGDTRVDIETAVAAEMLPIGVTWGFREEQELCAAGAKHIIHHPDELAALVC